MKVNIEEMNVYLSVVALDEKGNSVPGIVITVNKHPIGETPYVAHFPRGEFDLDADAPVGHPITKTSSSIAIGISCMRAEFD